MQGTTPILVVSGRPSGHAGIVVGARYQAAIVTDPDREAKVVVSNANGKVVGEFP
jgi:hypothetical protein